MLNVTKRDGSIEPLDLNKFHAVVENACSGLTGVSASEIEINSKIQFYDKIKTTDIQETLIKSAANLISEETPNYQYVAGRLINYHLRKEVYGSYTPIDLYTHYKNVVESGYYTDELLTQYSEEEFSILNEYIDHDRDDQFTYAAMEQLRGKYLIKNRVTGEFYETPQIAFMLISMCLFAQYQKNRLKYVKELYDAISTFDVSLPTPIMAGVRSPNKQFSSCTLIESGDSLDSILGATNAIVNYVSNRAGIGISAGAIRAEGSPVKGGSTKHTGVIPFYKLFQAAVKSCAQGGIRGGAATMNFPIWHLEVEDLLVLKNNKGTEFNRIRHMDYCVHLSKTFYERRLNEEHITLFSPNDVPGLYEAFYRNEDEFNALYRKYEADPKIRKKQVSAIELFNLFLENRFETGRIYFMNADHANSHGAFVPEVAPVKMTNLCTEILLTTQPLSAMSSTEGEIALCTLAAVNFGKLKKPSDIEKSMNILVRALDALLDYQDYPVLAAKNATMARRPLGIGIINLAYWMAKNDMTYSNANLEMLDEYMEAFSYYAIKASNGLAKERGPCPKSNETRYHFGITPHMTSKLVLDDMLINHTERLDWDKLRADLLDYGIRNSTLMACMPAESSAQVSNSTNGIEPPRSLISIKQSKDGVLTQVVPEIRKMKNKYELAYDIDNKGYMNIVGIITKWIDQAISSNLYYDIAKFEDGKIPIDVLTEDLLYAYSVGHKTGYYLNTNDDSGEEKELEIESEEISEEACDSCTI